MLWGTPLMNTSGTHWEHDGNMIIENFHPSWLYIQSSHWLHAYSILKHACHHFILPPQISLYKAHHTYCHIFLGFVWFCSISFFLFIYLLLFCGGSCLGFCSLGVLGVGFCFLGGMVHSLCPYWLNIRFVLIVLAFTL